MKDPLYTLCHIRILKIPLMMVRRCEVVMPNDFLPFSHNHISSCHLNKQFDSKGSNASRFGVSVNTSVL